MNLANEPQDPSTGDSHPIRTKLDKVSRAHGITPMCEAGRVLLPAPLLPPETKAWSTDHLTQLTSFPVGKHDDITDAFVYAVRWFITSSTKQRKSRFGWSGWMI